MFFRENKNSGKEPGPESEKIWKDLNNAEAGWCCKFLQELIGAHMTHIYFANNGEYVGIKINFCPRCGRKIGVD